MSDYSLLKDLCEIHAPSGNENALTSFILNYVEKNSFTWKRRPKIYSGKGFQDTIVLGFGTPRTVIYAHMDSVGYMVGYGKTLIPIGSPAPTNGCQLVGKDSLGLICCNLHIHETEVERADGTKVKSKSIEYAFDREIDRGTTLTYKPSFTETDNHIIGNNLDNRAGIFTALKLAETLDNGVIAFSCYEEHGGGTVPFLHRFIYKKYRLRQALIADITWVTEGVEAGKGCAVSMRDAYIPRRAYVKRVMDIARRAQIPFQLEVESAGGSDGSALQHIPYAIDWCFVGAPEVGPHSPVEKIHKNDLESMLKLYSVLMKEL